MRIRVALVALGLFALSACGDEGTNVPSLPDPGTVASRLPTNLPSLPTNLPTTLPPPPSLPSNLPTKLPTRLPGIEGMQKYTSTVKAQVPEAASGRTDAEIAAVGLQSCGLLKADRPAAEVIERTRSLGGLDAEAVDEATARELVKLAIDTICLDEKSRVDEF